MAGFNVHAGVTGRARSRDGLEKLCRYGARPPFRLERMALLPDGRVASRLRKPRRNGTTHLVLDPMHFLARIAALVPPPRLPLTRLAGVLAPHSPWRAAVVVVAYGRAAGALPPAQATPPKKDRTSHGNAPSLLLAAATPSPPREQDAAPTAPRTSLGAVIVKPVGARIDWASRLRRTYVKDVLACPCGGRRSVMADINDPSGVVAILVHLGLPAEPPPITRARSPSFEAP